MKRILLCLGILMSLATNRADADKISFAYDEAGNRVQRAIVTSNLNKAKDRSAGISSYRDSLGNKDIRLHYGDDKNIIIEFIGADWNKRFVGLYTIDGIVVETFEKEDK